MSFNGVVFSADLKVDGLLGVISVSYVQGTLAEWRMFLRGSVCPAVFKKIHKGSEFIRANQYLL